MACAVAAVARGTIKIPIHSAMAPVRELPFLVSAVAFTSVTPALTRRERRDHDRERQLTPAGAWRIFWVSGWTKSRQRRKY